MILNMPYFGKTMKNFKQNIKFTDRRHKDHYKCDPFVIDIVGLPGQTIEYPEEYIPLPKLAHIYEYSNHISDKPSEVFGVVEVCATHCRRVKPDDVPPYIVLERVRNVELNKYPEVLIYQDLSPRDQSRFDRMDCDLYKFDYDKKMYVKILSKCGYGYKDGGVCVAIDRSNWTLSML